MSQDDLLSVVKGFVPELSFDMHKGQSARIGVLGGCREYTGAPYYAAMSALRTGADLAHVFCTGGAAGPIKTYSPDLIVHPVIPDGCAIDVKACLDAVTKWFSALDVLVVGPGLGRDESVLAVASQVVEKAVEAHLLLVIDGDGLWMISHNLKLVSGKRDVILTPNMAEYSRLAAAVAGRDPAEAKATDAVPDVKELASKLGGVTILQKGARSAHGADVISDGTVALVCDEMGAPRRCGGQGDVLAGCTATFFAWARKKKNASEEAVLPAHAAYGAAALTRKSAAIAFESLKRSMLTTDIIQCIGDTFESLYDPEAFHAHDEDEDE